MYLLGFDIGSSSVKVSIIDIKSGQTVASAFSPDVEMDIIAQKPGWAEQHPKSWINNAKLALQKISKKGSVELSLVQAVGISYQMHGLVVVDNEGLVLRPAIIWCDSRAVSIGNEAFSKLGEEYCLGHLLNSPGNFTASKLKWVKDNEPTIYQNIHKAMLPGDYLAYYLTGEITTTAEGLSEGTMWDFKQQKIASELLSHYGIAEEMLPPLVDTFSIQGLITTKAAAEFGIPSGIPVAYRAGDQPNNAFSLNVLKPGEVAATAGTSGVVYGVTDQTKYDPQSRVNTFLHVNNTSEQQRLGVLLCINATGILNSWLRKNMAIDLSYEAMNAEAAKAPIGSDGLLFFPFGNGAERILESSNEGAQLVGLNFNVHSRAHVLRAAQEGIVFSFVYGMEIMKKVGIDTKIIKAGMANMFLSPLFRNTLAGVTGATIELYDTDGSVGAARGAGVGAGFYKTFDEAFISLHKIDEIKIPTKEQEGYKLAYQRWLNQLNLNL